jgi:hypothetical protein
MEPGLLPYVGKTGIERKPGGFCPGGCLKVARRRTLPPRQQREREKAKYFAAAGLHGNTPFSKEKDAYFAIIAVKVKSNFDVKPAPK